jgi:hypothetical protein
MGKIFSVRYKGDFSKTANWLKKHRRLNFVSKLDKYGERGVKALADATPRNSCLTADSWGYEIEPGNGSVTIRWTNSNVHDGVNVAVIIQYGHGTGTGGYVQGIDYINPALKDIFDDIAKAAWEEVTKD